jgi:fused signal recognition particle receptor
LSDEGKSVMLAAGDTFRAAAIEQLQTWGERLSIPVVAQQHGSDAAAVAFDAYQAAKSRNIDVLLIDTAGRQHTHSDLMEQLAKMTRVLQKANPELPHEVMLTVDAATGQNALSQIEHFKSMVGVSSLSVSKLDGTAKGGIVVAMAEKFGLPIRFIGVGESMDDLRPFVAADFARALLPETLGKR